MYTLREYRGTTVFVTFLDASKAFDIFNYELLFDNLVEKCVPLFFQKKNTVVLLV